MKRPRIGVTGPDRGGFAAWFFIALALLRAGARPRRIRPARPLSISEVDGLVLGGGVDIHPSVYGEDLEAALDTVRSDPASRRQILKKFFLLPLIYLLRRIFSLREASRIDTARDELEVSLLHGALDRGLPVLGICRGAQLINAALGGNLHREIRGFYTETPFIQSVLPRKRVEILPGTLLSEICPGGECRVNALNHQAVNRPAPVLQVCAREANGIIQAVEHQDRPFVLGVQWHPEFLPHLRSQLNIFRRLVREAGRFGAAS